MPEFYREDSEGDGARSVWSGTIAFGLVSLPVTLFTANRSRPYSLRLLDEDGTPLRRQFFCSKDDKALSRDDLIRGFKVDKEHYIPVNDDELDALAPKKSREIDLRRFVPLQAISPIYFDKAYFLLPEEGSSKAYRLLAKSMEDSGRAGIATFVMRGKEYLLSIIAEGGLLRAESLRFHDELRRPSDLALPPIGKGKQQETAAIVAAIDKQSTDSVDLNQLTDTWSLQLRDLIRHKLEANEDVLHAPEVESEEEGAEVIDLMALLKQRLAGKPADEEQHAQELPAQESDLDVDTTSKTELYELAKALNIHGRSQMSKQDLFHAIQRNR